jgi:hypothetical protein
MVIVCRFRFNCSLLLEHGVLIEDPKFFYAGEWVLPQISPGRDVFSSTHQLQFVLLSQPRPEGDNSFDYCTFLEILLHPVGEDRPFLSIENRKLNSPNTTRKSELGSVKTRNYGYWVVERKSFSGEEAPWEEPRVDGKEPEKR